ncbi:MAG: replication protein, partial [Ilumatobacteraceae bacterium]
YEICDDLETIPVDLRGLHDNPVNPPRLGGVQVELPPRVRGVGRFWKDWQGDGLTPHTESLIEALVTTAKNWPLNK